ncbi:MAG: hypothetical protein JO166_10345 [Deltaproteobacteria bacterium]|nr:hypothetical protein [Deltaproteobacteria bacterium]
MIRASAAFEEGNGRKLVGMTRRGLLAAFSTLPVVRSLDLVQVVIRCDGREYVRWEPRAVAEAQFRAVFSFIADMSNNRH